MMHRRRLLAAPALLAAAVPAAAQRHNAAPWASRSIRIIQPCLGDASGIIARALAERLGPALGQSVWVDGRSGAGGAHGAEILAGAPPDGSVLGLSNPAPHAVGPAILPAPRTHPLDDFTHLALLAELPLALAVDAAGPYPDLAGFLAAARAAPDGLRVGTSCDGSLGPPSAAAASLTRTALAMLRRETGAALKAAALPAGPAPDLVAGRIAACLSPLGEAAGQDRLRVLAVAADHRVPMLPAIPTFRELGVDLVAAVWFGLVAPAGLPELVAARLAEATRAVTLTPGYATLIGGLGAVPLRDLDRVAWTRFVAAEAERWGSAAREAGLRAE